MTATSPTSKLSKEMKLGRVDLSNTGVSDISVLAGMPLETVYLNGTRVKDSSPLTGAQLMDVDFSDTPLEMWQASRGLP